MRTRAISCRSTRFYSRVTLPRVSIPNADFIAAALDFCDGVVGFTGRGFVVSDAHIDVSLLLHVLATGDGTLTQHPLISQLEPDELLAALRFAHALSLWRIESLIENWTDAPVFTVKHPFPTPCVNTSCIAT